MGRPSLQESPLGSATSGPLGVINAPPVSAHNGPLCSGPRIYAHLLCPLCWWGISDHLEGRPSLCRYHACDRGVLHGRSSGSELLISGFFTMAA
jgi:hypothetical protein